MWFLVAPLVAAAGMTWAMIGVLNWRGGWRLLAAVAFIPLLLYALLVLVPDHLADSSSHNLLPFELGCWFWPSLPYMALIGAMRPGTSRPTS